MAGAFRGALPVSLPGSLDDQGFEIRFEQDTFALENLLQGKLRDLQADVLTCHRAALETLRSEAETLRTELARGKFDHFVQHQGPKGDEQNGIHSTRSGRGDALSPASLDCGPNGQSHTLNCITSPADRHVASDGKTPTKSSRQSLEESKTSKTLTSSQQSGMRFITRDVWRKKATAEDLSAPSTEALLELVGDQPRRKSLRGGQGMVPTFETPHALLSALVIHPHSKIRLMWGLMSILFLLYDAVLIPMDVCFTLERTQFIDWVQFLARLFWTSDIFLSFATGYEDDGVIVTSPKLIALRYLQTWFPFDFSLVTTEWLILGFTEVGGAAIMSLLRGVRWFRFVRMFRFLRIARLAKLKTLLQEMVVLSTDGLDSSLRVLKVITIIIGFAHLTACLWHLVGIELATDGWVWKSGAKSDTVARRYLISLHWTFRRLVGSSSFSVGTPTLELAFEVCILFSSVLFISWFMAAVYQADSALVSSDATQLNRLARMYAKRHRISKVVLQRTMKFLRANRVQGPGELVKDEEQLIQALPGFLQEDLLNQARAPLLCLRSSSPFGDLLLLCPSCVRRICHAAMTETLVVGGEKVFSAGEACLQMFVPRSGDLLYKRESEDLATYASKLCAADLGMSSQATYSSQSDRQGKVEVDEGQPISQPVLWTHWEHKGDFSAHSDSLLLVLNAQSFCNVVLQHKIALTVCLKFARHYTWELNQCQDTDDLTVIQVNLSDLDHQIGSDSDHFAFISHYKVEAGTEATLFRDLMDQMIANDPSCEGGFFKSPVFIDSEDLTDLQYLKQHVIDSRNLLLLLTPGLLSRPWCLVEIMTAHSHNLQIVPIEVQRPGIKYEYPDEDFYHRFRQGQVVSKEGMQLLEAEGCSLDKVEQAMRSIFLKIALPFSPHKSGNVRQAELRDIMKRCV